MLEGFKLIVDRDTLRIIDQRIRDIHTNLLKGRSLTKKEETDLKHYLRGMEGLSIAFRDDNHRLRLIDQWLKDAELHDKRLEEREEKAKR